MVVNYRDELHKIPELAFKEVKTKEYILNVAKNWDVEINETKGTGLVMYFQNNKAKTIAFRADMDAISVNKDGVKKPHHACGHDGHMAMVLSLGDYVSSHREEMLYNIVLIFQPSEEDYGGMGAQSIIESGYLEKYKVEAIFGLHMWPGLPIGKIYSKSGGIMAQSSETDIIIAGKTSHIANYSESIDALEIASRMLTDIYDFDKSVESYHLLKWGQIVGGSARNSIADKVVISGSIRSYSKEEQNFLKRSVEDIANEYELAYNCKITFDYKDGYPPVINDEKLFSKVEKTQFINILKTPVLQAEDFGAYTEKYPCVFSFLGLGASAPLHTPDFDFNSQILEEGVKYYIALLQTSF